MVSKDNNEDMKELVFQLFLDNLAESDEPQTKMTKEYVKHVRELMDQLRQSTSVEEVLQRSKPLGMDLTEEDAKEYLGLITSESGEKPVEQ